MLFGILSGNLKVMGNTVGSRFNDVKESFWAYVAGFLDGDGCIAIRMEKSKTCKLGYRVRVRISFTQHKKRRKVLDYLLNVISSGTVAEYQHNNMAEYVIRDQQVVEELLDHLEPYIVVKTEHLKLAQKLLILKRDGYSIQSLSKMFNLVKQIGLLNNYHKSFEFDPVTT